MLAPICLGRLITVRGDFIFEYPNVCKYENALFSPDVNFFFTLRS